MLEVIDKELKFPLKNEKLEWEGEAKKWRLPYWDWALDTGSSSKVDTRVPTLFKTKQLVIRAPRSETDKLATETIEENPLWRYQLKVGEKLTKLGDPTLGNYRINDVVYHELDAKKRPTGKIVEVLPVSPYSLP